MRFDCRSYDKPYLARIAHAKSVSNSIRIQTMEMSSLHSPISYHSCPLSARSLVPCEKYGLTCRLHDTQQFVLQSSRRSQVEPSKPPPTHRNAGLGPGQTALFELQPLWSMHYQSPRSCFMGHRLIGSKISPDRAQVCLKSERMCAFLDRIVGNLIRSNTCLRMLLLGFSCCRIFLPSIATSKDPDSTT